MSDVDRPRPGSRWALFGLMILALGLRLAYLGWFRTHDPLFGYLLHDARIYHAWATALVQGEPYTQGAFYLAPGYPYLLALLYRLFGSQPLTGYLFQTLLGVGTIFLVARVATRAYGSRAGLSAATLAALYGAWVFYEAKLLSAALAVFLGALVIERLQAASLSRLFGWVIAGGVTGLACIVRPNLLPLLGVVPIWILATRSTPLAVRARRIAGFAGAALLVLLPVTLHNYKASGEWIPVASNGGLTFFHGNNQQAEGWFSSPGMSGSVFTQREESRRLAEAQAGRKLGDAEVSRFWFRRGLRFIVEDPGGYLTLQARKAFLALDHYEHALEYNPQLDRNPWRWAFPVSFAVILALAALRLLGGGVTRAEVPLLVVLVVQAATPLVFYAAGRYRLPATVPLLALAGCGAVLLFDRLRSKRRWLPPLVIALLVALVSITPLPPDGAARYRTLSATSMCDIGLAYERTGRPEQALLAYADAIDRDPTYAYAHQSRARTLIELKRDVEAEASLRRAVELRPDLAETHFELGNFLLNRRRPEEAARAFADAFRADPGHAAAGSNLIGTYLTLGRRDDAAAVWRTMQRRGLAVQKDLDRIMRQAAQGR